MSDTPEEALSPSIAPTEDTNASVTPSAPISGEQSSDPALTEAGDLVANAETTEPVTASSSAVDEPEVEIAAHAAVIESALPPVYNIIDEDSKQFLVRFKFASGLILRGFFNSDEDAAVKGRVYRDAAVEKSDSLLSTERAS